MIKVVQSVGRWKVLSKWRPFQRVTKCILVLLKIGRFSKKFYLPYKIRVAVAESAAQNPLYSSGVTKPNSISVMIPCIEKDLPLLMTCIEGIKRNVINPVDKISIITNCPELIKLQVDTEIEVITEVNYLPQSIQEHVRRNIPPAVQGWVSKQLIVMYFIYMSKQEGVLTVDADTILLNPRVFLSDHKQILCPVVEYALHDAITTRKTWKSAGVSFGISFKAHHMLMKPKVVREMFDDLGGFEQGSLDWVNSTLEENWMPFSEFHSYATWILNRYPSEVAFAKWGNIRVSRKKEEKVFKHESPLERYAYLKEKHSRHNSVSFHHYLSEDFEELGAS